MTGRIAGVMVERWNTSLRFRTVLTTTVLMLTGIASLMIFLSNQIAGGLFNERFEQHQIEATRGLSQVANTFSSAAVTDRATTTALATDTLLRLEGDGASIRRDFILSPLPGAQNLYVGTLASSGLTTKAIPFELAEKVQNGDGVYWQSIGITRDTQTVPGLAFGTKVTLPPGNVYALYLIYDLSSLQKTMDFINSVMWLGTIVFMVMTIAIFSYVTRSVIKPVSVAANVSEELAAGNLDQRIPVTGTDELARLGTSFNKMANSLQQQINQLATLSAMQQRFVSDVSHELRTPLTTVRMAAQVLYDSRDEFDPINERSAELLFNQVERFQQLLADLLEISRFDAGAAFLHVEPRDMREIVVEVLNHAEILASANKCKLSLITQGDDFAAELDDRRVERITRNLINNAIEHAEGNPVDVILGATDTNITLAVRDYGLGMDEETMAHVFDRFWRADPARARTTGGSGLGLAIAKEDTQLHQGRLDVWAEPSYGACFRLVLPRSQDVPAGAPALELPPNYRLMDRQQSDTWEISLTELEESLREAGEDDDQA
ncbi:MtrAB system histidine kinase MtrB [Micrococcoides hystricis]|uniref:Sensor histidine kinase MtrB n=1 Tax=Micrococcoides hystricis TaxID=1572761 RepID=A0ABV6P870_9MICC